VEAHPTRCTGSTVGAAGGAKDCRILLLTGIRGRTCSEEQRHCQDQNRRAASRSHGRQSVIVNSVNSIDTPRSESSQAHRHIRLGFHSRSFDQEQYAARCKTQSELRGEPQSVSGTWRDLPSQRIRDTPRPSRASTSIDLAFEPKSRPSKAMRLRWHDRTIGRGPVPEPQERTKIGMGRKKLRSPVDARAVRIFKSDALRSSSSDGKGFDRRSASGGLHRRRWYLGSVSNSCRRIVGTDSAMAPDAGTVFGVCTPETERTSWHSAPRNCNLARRKYRSERVGWSRGGRGPSIANIGIL
jgi:hypothetical protein